MEEIVRQERPKRKPRQDKKEEKPIFNENALNNIGQKFKIDTVVTHTSPSFCELISKAGLSEWAQRDPNLHPEPHHKGERGLHCSIRRKADIYDAVLQHR